jgi:uncharacterized membrane protein YccC
MTTALIIIGIIWFIGFIIALVGIKKIIYSFKDHWLLFVSLGSWITIFTWFFYMIFIFNNKKYMDHEEE